MTDVRMLQRYDQYTLKENMKSNFPCFQENSSKFGKAGCLAIKVEPFDNGPLFTEIAVFQRILRPDSLQEWIKKNSNISRLFFLSFLRKDVFSGFSPLVFLCFSCTPKKRGLFICAEIFRVTVRIFFSNGVEFISQMPLKLSLVPNIRGSPRCFPLSSFITV